MRKTIGLLLLLTLLSPAAISAQTIEASTRSKLKATLQLKLEDWHKTGSFPGATLGVVLANGESFGLAVGLSDRDLKTPMKPDSRIDL